MENSLKKGVLALVWVAMTVLCASVASAKEAGGNVFQNAFKDLGDDDQVSLLQTINRSMAKESEKLDDKRIQTLYRINRDAVKGAPADDRKKVLAEVFATAPLPCLPYFTDMLAQEVFGRRVAGYGEKDEAFVEFASAALLRISTRCRTADNSPEFRLVYAVIMFLKASNGYPEDLRDSFLVFIPSGLHELARKEWIPAAMGDDGKTPTYQPMLEAGYRRDVPAHQIQLGSDNPAEIRNRLKNSEMPVGFGAWDVKSPDPAGVDHGIPGGDGTGVWRRPLTAEPPKDDGAGPYMGQTL